MGFLDQLKQLNELKSKMDEVKNRLDTITVSEENSYVKVTVNGNRKVTDIHIKQTVDNGELSDHLVNVLNEALAKADNLMQSEMKGVMPNIPGLG
ncbi:MAG: YbaB/EbfC family nucleoid-associated protein [Bacteroidetes bacterium]|nr:YbaB/EbfC family nucleoid-associated protein [Bacteroidota bacterium]